MKKPLRIERAKVASLFIDLQEEHRHDERSLVEGYDTILRNAARLQEAARRNDIPVLHCAYVVDLADHARPFHPLGPDGRSAFSDKDDPLTAICPEVAPRASERVLVKNEASAFGKSPLISELRDAGVEWLVIAGVWTEACIDATVKDAITLGLRVLLVKDACGSGGLAMHQTGILNLANRLYGGAVVDTRAACVLLEGDTVEAWQIEGFVPLRFTSENTVTLYAEL